MPKPTPSHNVQLAFTVSEADFRSIKVLCALHGCKYRDLFLGALSPLMEDLKQDAALSVKPHKGVSNNRQAA